MRVAFLGSGSAGLFVAAALSRAGYELVVWDGPEAGRGFAAALFDGAEHAVAHLRADGPERRSQLTEPEANSRIRPVETVAKALDGADLVISLTHDDLELHDLVMRQGLLDFMAADAVHVSMTPASEQAIRHLMEMQAVKQQRLISAPLIDRGQGTVSIVAAGQAESIWRVQPLLDAIVPSIVVGTTPWQANLVSLGISRLTSEGPDSVAEIHAMIRDAGISLELFQQAVRLPPPSGPFHRSVAAEGHADAT